VERRKELHWKQRKKMGRGERESIEMEEEDFL
jgi:hypothetical protein